MDYDGPDVENEDARAAAAARRRALFSGRWKSLIRAQPSPKTELASGDLDHAEKAEATSPTGEKCADSAPLPTLSLGDAVQAEPSSVVHRPHKHVAFSAPPSEVDPETTTPTAFSPGPSRAQSPEHSRASTHVDASASASASPPPAPARQRPAVRAFHLFRTVVRSACTPVSFAVLVALLIGLVPALKALFVASPTGPQLRPAPDGLPPLSVLLDTASFVGAGSVPLGLVCLGGALARLQVPRGAAAWARTPAGAIVALAIAKELVLPVLGVLIVEGLTKAGVISAEDRVLRFVCMWVHFLRACCVGADARAGCSRASRRRRRRCIWRRSRVGRATRARSGRSSSRNTCSCSSRCPRSRRTRSAYCFRWWNRCVLCLDEDVGIMTCRKQAC
jgi:hypothetical protein